MASANRGGERRATSAPLADLHRILDHERRLGCEDRAVIGGLRGFVERWAARQPAEGQSLARRVASAFDEYARLDPERRRALIERMLEAVPHPLAPSPGPAQGALRAPLARVPEGEATPANGISGTPATGPSGPPARPARQTPRRRSPSPTSLERGAGGEAPREAPPDAVLDTPAEQVIKGIGPENAKRLKKLGVETVRDLLFHFPRYHLDYRNARLIKDLQFEGFETILVSVWKVTADPKPSGIVVIRAIVADESGTAEALWIRTRDYVSRDLTIGKTIVLSGECRLVAGRPVFKDAEWESFIGEDTVHTNRLVPVYPLAEGIGGRYLRRVVKQTIDRYASLLQDHLPSGLRAELHLMDLPQAIAQAHFPDSDELKRSGQRRLAFDELLVIQLGVLWRRRAWEGDQTAPALAEGEERLQAFLQQLPFALTPAQERALNEIRPRLARACPMSLLLEGDVGSGKTVVATAAMVATAANGYQSALMAPTEILAEQHLRTLQKLVDGLGERAPRVTLLTGSVKGSERKERYRAIEEGRVDVVVGTQALVQEGLSFARLGFVVVDEQHRFGVAQRTALRQKGYNPHILVMTATPIPRTLALTLYGDLDLAVIDQLPPGRQPIKTRHLPPTQRPRAYEFVRREVASGHQAFIIFPLVEESERLEARAATEEYERLSREVFPELRLGLLHGRLKSSVKEEVMRQFQRHEIDILVSTAVVEVGIDVPNATVMLVEGANRFGLAQLHQFRGRVGRGDAPAYCLLISDTPSLVSDERLAVMEQSGNGFELAEKDLELRGPGEFFGTRQSGLPDLKMARLSDTPLLVQARAAAERLLAEDPRLTAPEHRLLRAKVAGFWQHQIDLN